MMDRDFDGMIKTLTVMSVIGVVSMFAWAGYGTYEFLNYKNENIIESNHIMTPTIKLHTDGKTVDTIYVYTFKK